jgi:hypothetical protein
MSERYWIFQNGQVVGPFSVEDLLSRPDFSDDALVCPEGRQGTDAGDWQRASLMPSIVQAMSKPKSPVPQAAQSQAVPSVEPGGDALLIKELSLLGAVHEKLGALGQSVSQMQESVKDVRRELDGFRSKFDGDNRQSEDWNRRIKNLEDLSASFGGLKDNIEKISSDSRAQGALLEESTRSQKRLIEELNQKLEALSLSGQGGAALETQVSDLNSRIQELTEKVEGGAQNSALSASLEELRGMLGGLKDEVAELKLRQEPAASAITSLEQPLGPAMAQPVSPQTPPEGASAGNMGFPPSPFAPPQPSSMETTFPQVPGGAAPEFILPTGNITDSNPAASPAMPMDISQPSGFGDSLIQPSAPVGAEAPMGISSESASADSSSLFESPSEVAEAPAKAQKKPKKGAWFLILIVAGGALFALAYVLGLIPGLELAKPKPAAQRLPLVSSPPSLPMPKQSPIAAPAPLPPEQETAFKDSAIQMVQNWPLSSGGKTVSQALRATNGPLGDLSPWSAEKIKDNLYQVNYQTSPSMNGTRKYYEFQADLSLHKVVGQNQAAVNLLSGKSQFHPVKKKLVKRRFLAKKKIRAIQKKKVVVKKKVVAKKSVVKKTEIMPGIPSPQSATGSSSAMPLPGSSHAAPTAQPQAAPSSGQSQNQELDQLLKP